MPQGVTAALFLASVISSSLKEDNWTVNHNKSDRHIYAMGVPVVCNKQRGGPEALARSYNACSNAGD